MPNLKWQINVLVQHVEKRNAAKGEGDDEGEAPPNPLAVAAQVPPAAQVADRTFLDAGERTEGRQALQY